MDRQGKKKAAGGMAAFAPAVTRRYSCPRPTCCCPQLSTPRVLGPHSQPAVAGVAPSAALLRVRLLDAREIVALVLRELWLRRGRGCTRVLEDTLELGR